MSLTPKRQDGSFMKEFERALDEMRFGKVDRIDLRETIRLKDRCSLPVGGSNAEIVSTSRDVWRPVSPCGQTDGYMDRLDTSPSTSFIRNPITMGIFTSKGIYPPHSAGDGNWQHSSRRKSYFSVPPLMEWTKTFASPGCRLTSSEMARAKWIRNGTLRSRSLVKRNKAYN